jgi:hypothetical protein
MTCSLEEGKFDLGSASARPQQPHRLTNGEHVPLLTRLGAPSSGASPAAMPPLYGDRGQRRC